MTPYRYFGNHARPLANGHVLGFGEMVNLTAKQQKENKRLIQSGMLVKQRAESGQTQEGDE